MNITRLISDYEALSNNEFYKLILDKLAEYSKARVNMLKTASIDKVPHIQGELSAIDYALGVPAILAAQLSAESKKSIGG